MTELLNKGVLAIMPTRRRSVGREIDAGSMRIIITELITLYPEVPELFGQLNDNVIRPIFVHGTPPPILTLEGVELPKTSMSLLEPIQPTRQVWGPSSRVEELSGTNSHALSYSPFNDTGNLDVTPTKKSENGSAAGKPVMRSNISNEDIASPKEDMTETGE